MPPAILRPVLISLFLMIGAGACWAASEAELSRHLRVPDGFKINLYAKGLGRARLMVLTPAGDILLSSPRSRLLLVKADRDGDGKADGVKILLGGLRRPHGLALHDGWLYIAQETRIVRLPYDAELRSLDGSRLEVLVARLPGGGGHWTRTIKRGPDGWFYVTIGSSCNVCIERHSWRAAMIRFKPGEKPELFATGLRNTVGFDWQPKTNALYGVDNGRDFLGDNFPPDELNKIVEGGFYGWPFFNGANRPDPDFTGRGAKARSALPPAYGFNAHVAPLSIRFLRNAKAAPYRGAALVAQHGSWNRSTKIGYRVVSLHWGAGGKITLKPFLTGFLHKGDVSGRPVDVLEAGDGTIFVSDDYAGAIWRISYTN